MKKFSRIALLLAVVAWSPLTGRTEPVSLKLPAIIGDHMVLQAGTADPIWGWAKPHESIGIQFIDSQGTPLVRADAEADATGRWSAQLPALKAGIAGKLRVSAGAESKEIEDVLTGQTWLCGGQSNMEFPMSGVLDAQREIDQANDPQLRLFLVGHEMAVKPRDDIAVGKWVLCAPQTVRSFSAVGYYFGKHLRSSLGEPVGLIGSYWGGTTAQVWTSAPALRQVPALQPYASQYDTVASRYPGPGPNEQFMKEYSDYRKSVDLWNAELLKNKEYQTGLEAWKKEDAAAKLAGKPEPKRPTFPLPEPVSPLKGAAGVPSLLFNAMIAPLAPFGIRGVIWFQADGNMGHPQDYGLLIKTLINDWRNQWKQQLPFYYVEMNNMRDYPQKQPVIYNSLSLIREQQQAALELPDTGVVCSIDLGLLIPEPHFPKKKPVGDRLALLALNDLYHQKGLVNSPAYKDFQVEGNKIRIHLTDADGLRVSPGHSFAGFAIKGSAGDWVWAQGRIDGDSVVLWNDAVPQPAAARYAWAMNPLISVENGASLPLRPFRTDIQSAQ